MVWVASPRALPALRTPLVWRAQPAAPLRRRLAPLARTRKHLLLALPALPASTVPLPGRSLFRSSPPVPPGHGAYRGPPLLRQPVTCAPLALTALHSTRRARLLVCFARPAHSRLSSAHLPLLLVNAALQDCCAQSGRLFLRSQCAAAAGRRHHTSSPCSTTVWSCPFLRAARSP
jgi:hypothetical protein